MQSSLTVRYQIDSYYTTSLCSMNGYSTVRYALWSTRGAGYPIACRISSVARHVASCNAKRSGVPFLFSGTAFRYTLPTRYHGRTMPNEGWRGKALLIGPGHRLRRFTGSGEQSLPLKQWQAIALSMPRLRCFPAPPVRRMLCMIVNSVSWVWRGGV